MKSTVYVSTGCGNLISPKAIESLLGRIYLGNSILIKPNLSLCSNTHGVCTSFEIVKMVACRLLDEGREVLIGESDAASRTAEEVFRFFQYTELPRVSLCNFSKQDCICKKFQGENVLLPSIVFKVDSIINIPCLKETPFCPSLGLKNSIGFVCEADKEKFHRHLDEFLIFLYKALPPQITLLDATYAWIGGFEFGRSIPLGFLFLSKDMIAIETLGSFVLGLDFKKCRLLNKAVKVTSETGNIEDIEIIGVTKKRLFEIRESVLRSKMLLPIV